MKIGIITFQSSYNYGSVLQAFALSRAISKLGHSVEIINYTNTCDFRTYHLFRIHLYKNFHKAFFKDVLYLKSNIKRKKNFIRFNKDFLPLTSKIYNEFSDMSELNSEFDAFICGSDQIWNCCFDGKIDKNFCLDFVENDKLKIAYAPSFGTRGKTDDVLNQFKKYLFSFDAVSVREKVSVPVVSKLAPDRINVQSVFDPTLLLDKDEYNVFISDKSTINDRYVFVYLLGHYKHASRLIQYTLDIAKSMNLKIVYISAYKISEFNKGIAKYGISPQEFLNLIYYADYVVSDSFHATVFSIIFEKQFMIFPPNPGLDIRIKPFLNMLGLENRADAKELLNDENIDFNSVNEIIEKGKKESIDYLKNSLSIKK